MSNAADTDQPCARNRKIMELYAKGVIHKVVIRKVVLHQVVWVRVCACVWCVCVRACACVCVHARVCACMHVCVCMRGAQMFMCVCAYVQVCVFVWFSACWSVCIFYLQEDIRLSFERRRKTCPSVTGYFAAPVYFLHRKHILSYCHTRIIPYWPELQLSCPCCARWCSFWERCMHAPHLKRAINSGLCNIIDTRSVWHQPLQLQPCFSR